MSERNADDLTPQSVWDERYRDLDMECAEEECQFQELFDKYLPGNGTLFEVGCYPGRLMIYLGRKLGYVVSGIDRTPYVHDRLRSRLEKCGVKCGELIEGDFFKFQSEKKYDVVCSFGFIEHFSDTEDVLKRHVALLKPGGILVISAPNFVGAVQFLLHNWLDRDNLSQHNLTATNLDEWSRILMKLGMHTSYSNYYGTAGFWVEADPSRAQPLKRLFVKLIQYSMMMCDKLLDYPNAAISPFMISISRKL
jgi:2-polyprenyl-3-methyl-5-hydroxy-6-metoxy-1,4-benzoquinol methylase